MITIIELTQLILAIIGLASIIVKMTPSVEDDEILGKIKSFVSKFIALNPENNLNIKVK